MCVCVCRVRYLTNTTIRLSPFHVSTCCSPASRPPESFPPPSRYAYLCMYVFIYMDICIDVCVCMTCALFGQYDYPHSISRELLDRRQASRRRRGMHIHCPFRATLVHKIASRANPVETSKPGRNPC